MAPTPNVGITILLAEVGETKRERELRCITLHLQCGCNVASLIKLLLPWFYHHHGIYL